MSIRAVFASKTWQANYMNTTLCSNSTAMNWKFMIAKLHVKKS